MQEKYKIILSGGGTFGSVTPLLAFKEIIEERHPDAGFVWVGTGFGQEKEMVEKQGIEFYPIYSGKFRRYFSILNFVDIFKIIIGFFQSFRIIWKTNPDICISVGGFVSVPVHCAAWLMNVPTWIHQQDLRVGLANRLMSPFASVITTAFQDSVARFSRKKTSWLGNPVRNDILQGNREQGISLFHLKTSLPVVLAIGGGTGSLRVNQLIVCAAQSLQGICQIIHLSGKDRPQELIKRAEQNFEYYQSYNFLDSELKHAYAVADLVIARSGCGTITELAALSKPVILIPKPGHQEENARFLEKEGSAVFVDERSVDGKDLADLIKDMLADKSKLEKLGKSLRAVVPMVNKAAILDMLSSLIAIDK